DENITRRIQPRRAPRGGPARCLRPDRGQSALDARRRARNPAAGACRSPRQGWRRPPRRLAGGRKVGSTPFRSSKLAYFYGLALTFRSCGGRRSDGGRKAAAFPVRECPAEPSRRGGRRPSNHGARSFPIAMAGTVKFFNAERGYGFIKPDDGGRDVFVHVTAVERAGLKSLTEGQRISFDVEPDKKGKGPKAVNLVVTG